MMPRLTWILAYKFADSYTEQQWQNVFKQFCFALKQFDAAQAGQYISE